MEKDSQTLDGSRLLIAVLGATGQVGRFFVELALARGHTVRALVRNDARLESRDHPKVQAVVGDATDPEDVAAVVRGADAVVSCLGNVGEHRIMEKTFKNILAAAAAQEETPRCLLITTTGCGGTSWLVKQGLMLVLGRASFMDYETADKLVRENDSVPTVLVRPYALTDKPGNGAYKATLKRRATFAKPIPRADVALFLADALMDRQWDSRGGVQVSGR